VTGHTLRPRRHGFRARPLSVAVAIMMLVVVGAAFYAVSALGPAPQLTATPRTPTVGSTHRRRLHVTRPKVLPGPVGISGKWKLILNSQFTGRSLDTHLWRTGWFGTGITGPINVHETACYRSANVSLPGDKTLHLAVTAVTSRCRGLARSYTGALLSTNPSDGRRSGGFTYRYGVLQAKVYVPGAAERIANWPAIITLGQVWPKDGEDDIMENLGGTVCSHFHSPGFAPGGPLGACDPTFAPGWHIVSANWEPGSVTWYYDGIEVAHITEGITSAPMYIVMVNSVSAKSPGVARPDSMRVAYVRVWQRAKPAGKATL
jgi:beta-glucanase (GH16 family)